MIATISYYKAGDKGKSGYKRLTKYLILTMQDDNVGISLTL